MSGVGVIILAAGGSTRMGRPKQLLPFGKSTLIEHIINVAKDSRCRPVVVVLGARADEIRPSIEGVVAVTVLNEDWENGISSSIRSGIEGLQDHAPESYAAILATCDQPFISSELLDKMVETHAATGKSIVAASYADTVGIPALFHASAFPQLLELSGDKGAKSVILKHRDESVCVDFPEGNIDLDTQQDYRALAKLHPQWAH